MKTFNEILKIAVVIVLTGVIILFVIDYYKMRSVLVDNSLNVLNNRFAELQQKETQYFTELEQSLIMMAADLHEIDTLSDREKKTLATIEQIIATSLQSRNIEAGDSLTGLFDYYLNNYR